MAEHPFHGDRLVTVFGGSGFVGRYIVRAFARAGWRVRPAMRRPDLAGFLQPMGIVGQVMSVQANVRYPESVAAAVEGADAVVNACGVKMESGRQSFSAVHAAGARAIAEAARAAGASSMVLISGIGADPNSANPYIASKGQGEMETRGAFPDAVVLRPSVVFGPEDEFFNRFAELARVLPVLPLFGGGGSRMQPVYCADVGLAAASVGDGRAAPGQTYELGGPDVMTLREAMQLALRAAERRRPLAPLPYALSRLMAQATEVASALTLGAFPKSLTTTRDQIDLLKSDNVVSAQAIAEGRTLAGLGIDAQRADMLLPSYLTRFRKTGQYAPDRFA